jgi:ATP-dependent helicase/DNAse subunit B
VRVSVITNDNICKVNEEILASVRESAKSGGITPLLVIVPDRFTLQAEKILLRDGGCLLNVRVVTFSMLYNLVFEELTCGGSVNVNVIDKTAAVLFMWRAIQLQSEKLVYFARSVNQYAFAEKMFNTVNQLTSSMADFKNLVKNAENEITRRKMQDIQTIYQTYKDLIGEYTDSSGMLGWLIENAAKSKIIKKAHVFLTGFEYLSVQRAAVVREISLNAGKFFFGVRGGSEIEEFVNELCFAM